MGLSGVWFRLRLWLSDRLLALGVKVQPEHRYNHAYSDDGETISIWREPVDDEGPHWLRWPKGEEPWRGGGIMGRRR